MSRLTRLIRKPLSWPSNVRSFIGGIIGVIKEGEVYANKLQEQMKSLNRSIVDTDQKLVFGSVGLAISSWAKMEEMLVVLVSILLRVPGEKAGLIMYSILNFNSWIEIVTMLFELDADLKPLQKRWNKLAERIRSIKDQRDQLAHHPIAESAAFIKAPLLDVRIKSRKQQPLTADEIANFANRASELARDLIGLSEAMRSALVAPTPNPDE